MKRASDRGLVGFVRELVGEVKDDNIANGAAALAFYLMLAVFPAAIVVLSVLPFLPIPHLEQALLDLLRQLLPGDTERLFADTVHQLVAHRRGGLLSFGLLFTVWSASNGLVAVMRQLDVAYDVPERRPFWKLRAIGLLLTVLFFVLVVGAFGLVVFGGAMQTWLVAHLGQLPALLAVFAVFRWVVIVVALVAAFELVYFLGPDHRRPWRAASLGSVFAAAGLIVASFGFRVYVSHFSHYDTAYGSLGAGIIMLLWLFIAGWVILLGAEINSVLEHRRGRAPAPREARTHEPPRHAAPA